MHASHALVAERVGRRTGELPARQPVVAESAWSFVARRLTRAASRIQEVFESVLLVASGARLVRFWPEILRVGRCPAELQRDEVVELEECHITADGVRAHQLALEWAREAQGGPD